jgi:hypothetical protein
LVFIDKIQVRKAALKQQMLDISALQEELDEAEQRCKKALSSHHSLESQP